MAELATLARPYARAAFEAARSDGDDGLSRFSADLALLNGCMQVAELRTELLSPSRVAAQKAALFADVLGDDLGQLGRRFVALLAEQSRLALLPEIQRQYELMRAEHERVLKVEVVSAQELSAEALNKLIAGLAKRFEREVDITSRVDPTLLGGAVIRAGDTVIDGSVRGRLERLADALGVTRASRDKHARPTAA